MFTISLPNHSSSVDSDGGYRLDHLRVMYPTLDIDQLVDRVAEVDRTAQSEGSKLRGRKFEIAPYRTISDARLRMDAMKLLQVIAKSVDDRHAEDLLFDPSCDKRAGLGTNDIFRLGERLGFEGPYVSALFDVLIDDGSLVTRVEEVAEDDGVKRVVRTFKPDGEAVSGLVRRFSIQWGLPRGF
jgi:hypothetical protein